MKTKVLVVCIGGFTRSVALKQTLNGAFNCDAMAVSAIWNDGETLRMLCKWADKIIPVEPQDLPQGPDVYRKQWSESLMWDAEFDSKRTPISMGPDIWGNPADKELRLLCKDIARKLFPKKS